MYPLIAFKKWRSIKTEMMLDDSQVAVQVAFIIWHWSNQKPVCVRAIRRGGDVMCCWCRSGWQRGSVAWHELRRRCSASQAELDIPGSAPGPGPAPAQDPQRRNQHPNRWSPRGGVGPASGLPAAAPRPGPGPALYALAASQPAPHASTDLHTSYLALLIYPDSSYSTAAAICFSSSRNSVCSMFVCYVWLFSGFHCWLLWQYKCSETDSSRGFLLCGCLRR